MIRIAKYGNNRETRGCHYRLERSHGLSHLVAKLLRTEPVSRVSYLNQSKVVQKRQETSPAEIDDSLYLVLGILE